VLGFISKSTVQTYNLHSDRLLADHRSQRCRERSHHKLSASRVCLTVLLAECQCNIQLQCGATLLVAGSQYDAGRTVLCCAILQATHAHESCRMYNLSWESRRHTSDSFKTSSTVSSLRMLTVSSLACSRTCTSTIFITHSSAIWPSPV